MKKGLILEGGAMRGLFTAGVIDVMMENNIEVDGIVGVSAGVCFGCNYKSRQIGRAIRYNVRFAKEPLYCSYRSLIATGNLFNKGFCYYKVPFKLDKVDKKAFKENPMEFWIVATDVKTGRAVYKKAEEVNKETMEWIRASSSMPLVSKVVEINGHGYLDGGISDSIPLKFFESIGYDRNIVITTQPEDYRKPPISKEKAMKVALKKLPAVFEAMKHRHEMYNAQVDYILQKEAQGEILVIRPRNTLPIDRISHDPDEMTLVYNIGREVATEMMPQIKKFYSEKKEA
ncbi:patatin family protein [Eubacterium sp.]|uniref:patatin-like phospholipase family protein n=1 Tax=Eubacterium sp. TaxID=142586 RepID=UPI0025EACEE9|nr:patatin family protein [Eubacterium sp.]MCR5629310.1 patatin family protein [Eubacterium sp.]